ncbi:MAG: 6-phosphofructokinase [Saprospiraceae bacterium]|nr:6-phosphofructokinase [Saprospiraceae bacterium]MBK6784655.1 6-phosphofructokinase [Saprospiraceae bacterium]MBK7525267.1 6-phosphofructokinase [Saprospiraceae bacterium]MBK8370286.1 6-phosphofructokinase [Saprospiraceae bacterium]MBK8546702.1 6-phosphofructokinase [Saprospiraceae bacterium]
MNNIKRIAVFTSGGDAPGMNAAVRAVVRTAIYHDLHVYGIIGGYDGMIKGNIKRLEIGDVANIIQRGGTMLKTARSSEFMTIEGRKQAYENLVANDIDACVAIGGNGTYKGADVFGKEFDFPMVGIPGTIDNDIYGTDYTIGFDTAINTAIEAVDKIRDTADSHNRLFFVEVMGRHSGFIALHTGIGSGAGGIFIPEVNNSIEDLIHDLRKASRRQKLFNLIIVAEGNQNGDATTIAQRVKESNPEYDVRVTIIGHLQRGGSPTAMDRVLASRMGHSAVLTVLRGDGGVALGVINDKIIVTPFEDAVNKTKHLNKELLKMAEVLAM